MTNEEEESVELHQMQIYSHLGISPEISKNVVDYTEYKLRRFEKSLKDVKQKNALNDLLNKYKEGRLAVGWKDGRPTWAVLKRDNI